MAFWKKRRKDAALFHKASIGGDAGRFLAPELTSALASDAVVGVVLNTIDDALDSGQQSQRTVWSLGDITYLRELLVAARSYACPVVLVADHGHIIDRGRVTPAADGGGSARWRPDTDAGDGEVVLSGPRVLEGDGTITAPWHEDIRYVARRAGYHGGASLAEITALVLVLLPSKELAPPATGNRCPGNRPHPPGGRPPPRHLSRCPKPAPKAPRNPRGDRRSPRVGRTKSCSAPTTW
ncbi:BREX-2 system phosphatase PglZ [Streptomyces hirsutus]|uniref:BREX-2 system phosphatase PglZ n=1 Tax=Streptomyces hirsutus TaxID=35620 RepID=UPI00331F6EB3